MRRAAARATRAAGHPGLAATAPRAGGARAAPRGRLRPTQSTLTLSPEALSSAALTSAVAAALRSQPSLRFPAALAASHASSGVTTSNSPATSSCATSSVGSEKKEREGQIRRERMMSGPSQPRMRSSSATETICMRHSGVASRPEPDAALIAASPRARVTATARPLPVNRPSSVVACHVIIGWGVGGRLP